MPLSENLENTIMLKFQRNNKKLSTIHQSHQPLFPQFVPLFLKHSMGFSIIFPMISRMSRTGTPAALVKQCCWWCCGRSLVVASMGQTASSPWCGEVPFCGGSAFQKSGDFPIIVPNRSLPSGKLTMCYWKWLRNSWFTYKKWWFTIVMLVYQRVCFVC